MPLPWLQLIDAGLGVANFARGRKAPSAPTATNEQLEAAGRAPGGLEARLAGVVVAALKEAFERDTRRLDLEREQLEAERERAERALRLELQRQAGDREIGRLRLLAGVAGAALARHAAVRSLRRRRRRRAASRSASAGCSCSARSRRRSPAQSRVAAAIDARTAGDDRRSIRAGASGGVALWLMICGLVLAGLAALLA